MSTEVVPFQFHSHEVRTITDERGEPWFVAKDVCDVLGLGNITKAMEGLEPEERNILTSSKGIPGNPNVNIINESGLYALIFKSRKPEAKAVRRWVTSEVIPAIRKTGGYIKAKEGDTPEMILARAVLVAQDTINRQKAQIADMRPKALFADAVASSNTSILVGELAKLLKQNGINIGQNRLFTWLRKNGWLIKRNGVDYNMPTQKSMESGLFEIKEWAVNNPDGSVRVTKTPKVTGKGQLYFVNLFLKEQDRNIAALEAAGQKHHDA